MSIYENEQEWNVDRCTATHYGDRCFMSAHPASDDHAAWLNGMKYVTWTYKVPETAR